MSKLFLFITLDSCSFAGHFCSWKNDNKDDFDWLLKKGATTTRETGPSSDADGDGEHRQSCLVLYLCSVDSFRLK